jgi:hypothetical protein
MWVGGWMMMHTSLFYCLQKYGHLFIRDWCRDKVLPLIMQVNSS